jgi:hypothetical protein
MEKESKIQIIKYCLITAIVVSWLYDFYLFYKYDRLHPINIRAYPCININTVRLQLGISSVLIIRYFTLNKIRFYGANMLICVFIFVLYLQNLILLNRFSCSTTCESNDTISDVIKIITLPLLIIYIFLIRDKRLSSI